MATPASGTGCTIAPASGCDDWDWLASVAWALLGKDPGQQLHYITGYPVTSCRAYVAKDRDKRRAPPSHFTRKLFRSDQGAPFLDAFMQGCTAPWWREQQRNMRLAAAAERFRAEIDGG